MVELLSLARTKAVAMRVRFYRMVSAGLLLLSFIQLALVLERVWAAFEKRYKFDWDPAVSIYLNRETTWLFYLCSFVLIGACIGLLPIAKRFRPEEEVKLPVATYVLICGVLIFTFLALSPLASFTS
jgi:hypothetical protein